MKRLRPTVHNFLGTYLSRYCDYDGYWLFGFLVEHDLPLELDLLRVNDEYPAGSPLAVASQKAVHTFAEQAYKNGARMELIASARLKLSKPDEQIRGWQNNHGANGWLVRCEIIATTVFGRNYTDSNSIFVAPHNPNLERRSAWNN